MSLVEATDFLLLSKLLNGSWFFSSILLNIQNWNVLLNQGEGMGLDQERNPIRKEIFLNGFSTVDLLVNIMLWYFTFYLSILTLFNKRVFITRTHHVKRTMPFGAKTIRANYTLERLLPLYFLIRIGCILVLFKNMYDEK